MGFAVCHHAIRRRGLLAGFQSGETGPGGDLRKVRLENGGFGNNPAALALLLHRAGSGYGRKVRFISVALALALPGTLAAVARPMPPWIGWSGWLIVLAMFFIRDPNATEMHRLGGGVLLAWFLAVATLLFWKGTAQSTLPDYHTIEDDN